MHTQNKPACDRNCFRCPYPDCILDEEDMSPEDWRESTERERSIKRAGRSEKAARNAAYYQANKEKIAAQQAAYYQANKEKIAAYYAAYYRAHKDEINARRREKAAAAQGQHAPRITSEEAR